MKTKLFQTTLLIASLGALSATAFAADAGSANGWSVSANVESAGAASNATDGTADAGRSTSLGLQARYDWSLTPTFSVGAGLGYSTGNHQAGTYANGTAATASGRYSLDVVPAYALNKDLQVFGKVSALYANVASNDGSSNAAAQGVGYGIGLRQMLDRNVYWQAGYDLNRYQDVTFSTGTSSSVQENVFSLGVGYKF